MGTTKRYMENREHQHAVAIGIAVEAGVLERCDIHDGIVFNIGGEIEEAYRLGNTKFSRGQLDGAFESRRDMTDAIKEVVESPDHANDRCEACFDAMHGDD